MIDPNDFFREAVRIFVAATDPDGPLSPSDQGKARNLAIYAMDFEPDGPPLPFMVTMMAELKTVLKWE